MRNAGDWGSASDKEGNDSRSRVAAVVRRSRQDEKVDPD